MMVMMMMMMMMSNLSQGKSVPLPPATLQVQQDQDHRAGLTGLNWKHSSVFRMINDDDDVEPCLHSPKTFSDCYCISGSILRKSP